MRKAEDALAQISTGLKPRKSNNSRVLRRNRGLGAQRGKPTQNLALANRRNNIQPRLARPVWRPAVTHVDGSGRLQTVVRHTNPRFYRLIESFRALTGVPIVLDSSFNENEPVVCRPDEALDCFLRTRMDLLVLGNVFVARGNS
jgi:predicted NodU family carbamoyl transferase